MPVRMAVRLTGYWGHDILTPVPETGTTETLIVEVDRFDKRGRRWGHDNILMKRQDWDREQTTLSGERHGESTTWYSNGMVDTVRTYRHGRPVGLLTRHRDDGKKWLELDYDEGKLSRVVTLLDDEDRETVLPEGKITVWKACRVGTLAVYVQISVPAEAKRVTVWDPDLSYTSRIEYGEVIGIEDDTGKQYPEAESFVHDRWTGLRYVTGQVVRPDGFEPKPEVVAGKGISVHAHRTHCTRWFQAPGLVRADSLPKH